VRFPENLGLVGEEAQQRIETENPIYVAQYQLVILYPLDEGAKL